MKKLIALLLSIFTILLVSTCAFAFSGGGISGGVNGDGDFTGGGFSGGSRLSSVFGSSPPSSSSLSTMLSYEALNNLTANINLGISLGEIEILDGNIQAVTVTKRTDWNAYVITGVYNGNTYVIVNASGGRYYSPINEGYSVVAIAGVSNYYLTNRPAGTTGNGYLGDLYLTYDNWLNIQSALNNLTGDKSYYTYGHSINGEFRYYLANRPSTTTYYVCNSAGQLFYTIKDTGSSEDTGGGGSTFDPTEVITAINSVYDAINSQGSRLANGLSQLTITANTISDILNLHMNNVVDGFGDIQNSLSTLNSYFTDLSGLFPVQETITLLGSDTRVAWDSADRITNVTTSGFNGDLIVKERPGDLVDESGYEKVTINETEYSLYNDSNGYRRIKAANEYPDTGPAIPEDTLFYFPFDDTLSSSVGDITLSYGGTPVYATGVVGDAFVFNGMNSLTADLSSDISILDNAFTFSIWVNLPQYPVNFVDLFTFKIGTNYEVSISVNELQKVEYRTYRYLGDSASFYFASEESVPLNTWVNLSISYSDGIIYCFFNGNLLASQSVGSYGLFDGVISFDSTPSSNSAGLKLDEVIFVNGSALWTSSYDVNESLFSSVVSDYFLPCVNQEITLNFYDSTGEQVTEHRWNQYTVNTSRLPDGYTELDFIQSTGTQYINTLFKPNQNTCVILDFQQLSSTGNWRCIFGARNNVSNVNGLSLWVDVGNHFAVRYGADGQATSFDSVSILQRYTVDFNKNVVSIGTSSYSFVSSSFQCDYPLFLFSCDTTGSSEYYSSFTLYSCQIYDNGTLVRDFVPCKNSSNAVGLYDLVNGQFYGNSGTGSFTAGNEVSNGSGIGQLVGVVSSTNRNAYPDDGEQDGFYYEYIGAFTEYPSFSQTLSPTDVNGNAITMGRLEDDFSEIYMDISTMQWYCHDPQTQTEILLSSANQEIMNDTIYVRQNYTMLPADQITADALQNLLPVDSPVYLDMPEGAKLTITYDHYTGWFRMMYILMDKQTKLLSDLDIVNETIINVENTVIDITNSNPAYNVFYITKTDGTTESVGDAAKDAAVFVGDILSMFYRLVFDDALDNAGVIQDFEDVLTTTNTGVNVW